LIIVKRNPPIYKIPLILTRYEFGAMFSAPNSC
jgi:hypothetical protein